MSPHAMPMPAQSVPVGVPSMPASVDPAYWGQQDFASATTSPVSPPLGLNLSPTVSVATQVSRNGGTPPVQTPRSDTSRATSLSEPRSIQRETNNEYNNINSSNGNSINNSSSNNNNASTNANSNNQTRASVAVACVPCRSRHLKCDGGVRCSRCRTDNVECTYIKSRRGWKGKRKNKEDATPPATLNNGELHHPFLH